MTDEQCGNCKFWDEGSGQFRSPRVGKCRRNPPTIVGAYPSLSPSTMTRYPESNENAWCGEWQRAQKRAEQEAPNADFAPAA